MRTQSFSTIALLAVAAYGQVSSPQGDIEYVRLSDTGGRRWFTWSYPQSQYINWWDKQPAGVRFDLYNDQGTMRHLSGENGGTYTRLDLRPQDALVECDAKRVLAENELPVAQQELIQVQADLLDEQIVESDLAAELIYEEAIERPYQRKIRDRELGLRRSANHNATRSAAMPTSQSIFYISDFSDWSDVTYDLTEDLDRQLPGNMISDTVFSAWPYLGETVPANSSCTQIRTLLGGPLTICPGNNLNGCIESVETRLSGDGWGYKATEAVIDCSNVDPNLGMMVYNQILTYMPSDNNVLEGDIMYYVEGISFGERSVAAGRDKNTLYWRRHQGPKTSWVRFEQYPDQKELNFSTRNDKTGEVKEQQCVTGDNTDLVCGEVHDNSVVTSYSGS